MELITHSASETKKVGRKLATLLKGGDILCLYGDLGSGKTTFVKGLAEGLGIERAPTSPSFILIREYKSGKKTPRGIKKIYHIDLYRLDKKEEVEQLGLTSLFNDKEVITVIEWAEKAKNILPQKRLDIVFDYQNYASRKLQFVDNSGRNIIRFLDND